MAEAVRLAKDLDLPVEGLKEAMRANGQLGRMTESFGLQELPDRIIQDGNILPMRRTSGPIIQRTLSSCGSSASGTGWTAWTDLAAAEFLRTYRLPDGSGDRTDNDCRC